MEGTSALSSLIFLLLLIAIFYFMLIRPQKRRVESHRALVESLTVGDEVITIGGLHGRITSITDDDVEIEVAPKTVLRFVKSAIARKEVDEVEDPADPAGE